MTTIALSLRVLSTSSVGIAVLSSQGNATRNANLITISAYGIAATVTALPPMHYQRAFHNSVVLPDGKVFITGGQVRNSHLFMIPKPALWHREHRCQTQHAISSSNKCRLLKCVLFGCHDRFVSTSCAAHSGVFTRVTSNLAQATGTPHDLTPGR